MPESQYALDVITKLRGWKFEVEDDPDYPDFFSVFTYRDGSGCEIAGKIGERSIAFILANYLTCLCKENEGR